MDENIALMLEKILDSKEENRAVVFSELNNLIIWKSCTKYLYFTKKTEVNLFLTDIRISKQGS